MSCFSNLYGHIPGIAAQLEPPMEADVVVACAGGRDEAGARVDVGVGDLGACMVTWSYCHKSCIVTSPVPAVPSS